MLFINTRPQDRAENLSHALRMAQIEVLDLPLLELVAQPWSDSLSELYQRLPSTQVIVVVSPTAVEIGMDYLTKASLSLEAIRHIQWIAVGETTAQALAQYGITVGETNIIPIKIDPAKIPNIPETKKSPISTLIFGKSSIIC